MCRSQNKMLAPVDECTLTLCIRSPEDEYEVFTLFGKDTYGGIRKSLPAAVLMRTCLMGTDS